MSLENNLKNKPKQNKKRGLFYNFCYDFVKITGIIPALIWMRPKVYYPFGKPNKKGAIMVSANHNTLFDPIVVQIPFPLRRVNCLATKDLFDTELKKQFFVQMHCIMVDKDNFSLASFHEVVNCLQEGKVVVIFPEGKLNHNGTESILAFKSGAVLMAHRAGAPIVPMYIVKPQKWYHRQHIVVGMPLNVSEMLGKMPSMQDLNNANDILRQKEVELREYFESLPVYKKMNPQ